MAFLSRFFGNKYQDEQLISHAQTAIVEDPLVSNVSKVSVSSEDGVVTIEGTVHTEREKDHLEGSVREALRTTGLKYERVVNNLQVEAAPQAI